MLIDQLCQAYHWTFEEALSMTMPQVILMSHAASVNGARMKASIDAKGKGREAQKVTNERDPVVYHGKRLSQLTPVELEAYYSDWT